MSRGAGSRRASRPRGPSPAKRSAWEVPVAETCALRLRELRKNFGATQIIRNVSLDVATGERHPIIGPNGAGKSTRFNLVGGRFAPTTGSIRLDDEENAGLRPD